MGFLDFADKFVTPKKAAQYAGVVAKSAARVAEKANAKKIAGAAAKKAATPLAMMDGLRRSLQTDEDVATDRAARGVREVAKHFVDDGRSPFSRPSPTPPPVRPQATASSITRPPQPAALPRVGGSPKPLPIPGMPTADEFVQAELAGPSIPTQVKPTPTPTPTPQAPAAPSATPLGPTPDEIVQAELAGSSIPTTPLPPKPGAKPEKVGLEQAPMMGTTPYNPTIEPEEQSAFARDWVARENARLERRYTQQVEDYNKAVQGRNYRPPIPRESISAVAADIESQRPKVNSDIEYDHMSQGIAQSHSVGLRTKDQNNMKWEDNDLWWRWEVLDHKQRRKGDMAEGFIRFDAPRFHGDNDKEDRVQAGMPWYDIPDTPEFRALQAELQKQLLEGKILPSHATTMMQMAAHQKALLYDKVKSTVQSEGYFPSEAEIEGMSKDLSDAYDKTFQEGFYNELVVVDRFAGPLISGDLAAGFIPYPKGALVMGALGGAGFWINATGVGPLSELGHKYVGKPIAQGVEYVAPTPFKLAEEGISTTTGYNVRGVVSNRVESAVGNNVSQFILAEVFNPFNYVAAYATPAKWGIRGAQLGTRSGMVSREAFIASLPATASRSTIDRALLRAGFKAGVEEVPASVLLGPADVIGPGASRSALSSFMVEAAVPTLEHGNILMRGMQSIRNGNRLLGVTQIVTESAFSGLEPDIGAGLMAIARNPAMAGRFLKTLPSAARASLPVMTVLRNIDLIRVASGPGRLAAFNVDDPVMITAEGANRGLGGIIRELGTGPNPVHRVQIGDEIVEIADRDLRFSARAGDDVVLARTRALDLQDEANKLKAKADLTPEETTRLEAVEEMLNKGVRVMNVPEAAPRGRELTRVGPFSMWVKSKVGDKFTAAADWLSTHVADELDLNPAMAGARAAPPPGPSLANSIQTKYGGRAPDQIPDLRSYFQRVDNIENRREVISDMIEGRETRRELQKLRDQMEWEIEKRLHTTMDKMTGQDWEDLLEHELVLTTPSSARMSQSAAYLERRMPFYDPEAEVHVVFDETFRGDEAQRVMIENAIRALPQDMREMTWTVGTMPREAFASGDSVPNSGAFRIRSDISGTQVRGTSLHEIGHAAQRLILAKLGREGEQALKQIYQGHANRLDMPVFSYYQKTNLSNDILAQADAAYKKGGIAGKDAQPVSSYALMDFDEYFSESFALYLRNPEMLEFMDPEAFKVFSEGLGRVNAPGNVVEEAEAVAAGAGRQLDLERGMAQVEQGQENLLRELELDMPEARRLAPPPKEEGQIEAEVVGTKEQTIDNAIKEATERYGPDSDEVTQLLFRRKRGEQTITSLADPLPGTRRVSYGGGVFDVPRGASAEEAVKLMRKYLTDDELKLMDSRQARKVKTSRAQDRPGREVVPNTPDYMEAGFRPVNVKDEIARLEAKISESGGSYAPYGDRELLEDMKALDERGIVQTLAPEEAPAGMRLMKHDAKTHELRTFYGASEMRTTKGKGGTQTPSRRFVDEEDDYLAMTDEDPILGQDAQAVADAAVGRAAASQVFVETEEPKWFHVSNVHARDRDAHELIEAQAGGLGLKDQQRKLQNLREQRVMETGGGAAPAVTVRVKGKDGKVVLKKGTLVSPYAEGRTEDIEGAIARIKSRDAEGRVVIPQGKVFVKFDETKQTRLVDIENVSYVKTKAGKQQMGGRHMSRVATPAPSKIVPKKAALNYGQPKPQRKSAVTADEALTMDEVKLATLDDVDLRAVGDQLHAVPSKDRATYIRRIQVAQEIAQKQMKTAEAKVISVDYKPKPKAPSGLTETGLLPKRTRQILDEVREGGVDAVEGSIHMDTALREFGVDGANLTTAQKVRTLRSKLKAYEKKLAADRLKYEAELEIERIKAAADLVEGKPTPAKIEQAVDEVRAQEPEVEKPPTGRVDETRSKLTEATGKPIKSKKVAEAKAKIEAHPNESEESVEAAAVMQAADEDFELPVMMKWTDEDLENMDTLSLWSAVRNYYVEKEIFTRGGTSLGFQKLYFRPNKTRQGLISQIKRFQMDEGVRPRPEPKAEEPKEEEVTKIYEDEVPPDLVRGGELDGRRGPSSEKELEEMLAAEERPVRVVQPKRKKDQDLDADEVIEDAAAEVQNSIRAQKPLSGGGGGKKGGGKRPTTYQPAPRGEEPDDIPPNMSSKAYKKVADDANETLRSDVAQGNSMSSGEADAMRADDRDLFKIKDGYFVDGVTPKDPSYSMDIHDVIQSPQNYEWADPRALAHAEAYGDKIRAVLREVYESGAIDEATWKIWNEMDYFPRSVTELDGEVVFFGPRTGIGAKQSFEMPREWDTAGEARNFTKTKYVNEPAAEFELYLRKARAIIAHEKFSNTIKKYGRTSSQRINKVFAERVGELKLRQDRLRSEIRKLNSRITRGAHRAGTELRGLERQINTLRAKESRMAIKLKGMKGGTEAQILARGKLSDQLLEVRQQLVRLRQEAKDMSASALNDLRTEKALRNDELTVVNAQLSDAKKWKAREMLRASKARPGTEATLPVKYGFASGYVFPKAFAEHVRRGLEPTFGNEYLDKYLLTPLEWMRNVNSIFTPLWATGDLSVLGIQALTSMGMNPAAFIYAAGRGMISLQDPVHYYRYMKANYEVVQEMNKYGILLSGHDTTFDEVFGGAGTLAKVGQNMTRYLLLKASNDLFTRIINVQAIELWKAGKELTMNTTPGWLGKNLREVYTEVFNLTPGAALDAFLSRKMSKFTVTRGEEGLRELAEVISNLTGRMSLKAQAKMGPLQKLVLSALPFAGRYTMAWLTLVTRAVKSGGLHGALARRALVTFGAAMTGIYIGLGYLIGQKPNLDPSDPSKFFTYDVLGQRVGPGGMVRGFVQLGAKAYEDYDDPEAMGEHILKWAMGRSSPVIQVTRDLLLGHTFEGHKLRSFDEIATYGVSKFTPFTVQGIIKELEQADVFTRIAGGEKVIDVLSDVEWARVGVATAGQALGGRTFPVSLKSQFDDKFEQTLRDQGMTDAQIKARETGAKYNNESPADRKLIEDTPALKDLSDRMDEEALKKGREYAEKEKEREEKIEKLEEDSGINELAERVLAGDQVAAAQWSSTVSDFFQERSGINKAYFDDEEDKETKTKIGALVDEYYKKGDPDLYRDETGFIDYDARQAALDKILAKMDPKDAATLRNRDHFLSEAANQAYEMRKTAQKKKDAFDDQPKYKLLRKDQEDDLADFINLIEAAQTERVLETGKTVSKSKWIRHLLKIGWTGADKNVMLTAYYLSTDHLHDLAYGTGRVEYLNNNPDLVLFYPYLYDELRDEEKGAYLELNPDQAPYLESRYGEVDGSYGTLDMSGMGGAGGVAGAADTPFSRILGSSSVGPLTQGEKAGGVYSAGPQTYAERGISKTPFSSYLRPVGAK